MKSCSHIWGCGSVVRVLVQQARSSGLHPQSCTPQVWSSLPVIPPQDYRGREFKVILNKGQFEAVKDKVGMGWGFAGGGGMARGLIKND